MWYTISVTYFSRKHDPKSRDYEGRLKKKYGLTWDQYTLLWESQGRKCAICRGKIVTYSSRKEKGPRTTEKACVDHDHETGRIRGLLCSNCNTAVGLLKDDPDTIDAAAEYLRRHT